MNSTTLFGMALGLQSPWQVNDVSFSAEESGRKELHLHIGFPRGSRFPDEMGCTCPVYDTVEREWQHLNFFEHRCFLHCAVPRITTSAGKVRTVEVPWARPGSGFTLLFEAFAMALIELYPMLGRAYRLKVLFNDLWEMPTKEAATMFLTNGCNEVEEAKIPAFMAFAKMVKGHWSGIIHFVESRITNGILEGIKSKVQLAKRRARGYRNTGNFINMIYFLCGKLKFDYPLYFT